MDSFSWDVVLWKTGNSCDYVPSSWAVSNKKNVYWWPKLSAQKTMKLIDACEKPSPNINFTEEEGVCKATVYSLERARQLISRAEYTSNLSSSEEEYVPSEDENNGVKRLRTASGTPKRYEPLRKEGGNMQENFKP